MWDLPGPGLKSVSPALAGGFLTTAPPGKSLSLHLDLPPDSNVTHLQRLKDYFSMPLLTVWVGLGPLGLRAPDGQEVWVWVLTVAVQSLALWPSG